MSHFSKIKTQIVEKDLLLKALKDLGYEFVEGDQVLQGFGSNQVKVDIRIPLRLSYDIGFRKSGDNYEIVADWWGVRGLKQKEFSDKVMQRYAYHAAMSKLEEQGFSLVQEETEKGKIHLVMRRMG